MLGSAALWAQGLCPLSTWRQPGMPADEPMGDVLPVCTPADLPRGRIAPRRTSASWAAPLIGRTARTQHPEEEAPGSDAGIEWPRGRYTEHFEQHQDRGEGGIDRCFPHLDLTARYEWSGAPVTPLWIDDESVDSAVMLAAVVGFLHCFGTTPLADWIPFSFYECKGREGAIIPRAAFWLKTLECKRKGCRACSEQRGGFRFRWAAKEWLPAYVRMMSEEYGCRINSWHMRRLMEAPQGVNHPCAEHCLYCHRQCDYLGHHRTHKCVLCSWGRRLDKQELCWRGLLAGEGLQGLPCTNEQCAFLRRLAIQALRSTSRVD